MWIKLSGANRLDRWGWVRVGECNGQANDAEIGKKTLKDVTVKTTVITSHRSNRLSPSLGF